MSLINDALKDIESRQNVPDHLSSEKYDPTTKISSSSKLPWVLFVALLFGAVTTGVLLQQGPSERLIIAEEGIQNISVDAKENPSEFEVKKEPIATEYTDKSSVFISAQKSANESQVVEKESTSKLIAEHAGGEIAGMAIKANGEELPEAQVAIKNSVPASSLANEQELIVGVVAKSRVIQEAKLPLNIIEAEIGPSDFDTISKLLVQAREAEIRQRLTVPERESALYFYQQVLARDANNQLALLGLERIETRYRELIDNAVTQEDWEKAERLLARAPLVGLVSEQLSSYQQLVKSKNIVEQQYSTKKNKSSNNKSWVSETERSQDRNIYPGIQNLIVRGEYRKASELLNKTKVSLRKYDEVIKHVELLFQLGEIEKINGFIVPLEDSYELKPTLQAKLAAFQRKDDLAIKILSATESAKSVEKYHNALLAGLYQKNGKFIDAQRIYKELIQENRENARFWLGYALASDSLGEYDEALDAYKRVNYKTYSDTNVSHFVSNRIARLNRVASKNTQLETSER